MSDKNENIKNNTAEQIFVIDKKHTILDITSIVLFVASLVPMVMSLFLQNDKYYITTWASLALLIAGLLTMLYRHRKNRPLATVLLIAVVWEVVQTLILIFILFDVFA